MTYKVVLDIDGVVADFNGAFCKKFGWERQWEFCLEERYPDNYEDIQMFVENPKTYKNLDIIPLGIQIAKFCENERFEIRVVSSRPKETIDDTARWLKQNKVPFFSLSVDYEWRSPKVSRIRAIYGVRFAVEDNLSVAKQLAEFGIPVFLIDWPWNQTDDELSGIIYRISNFPEFLAKYTAYFDDF